MYMNFDPMTACNCGRCFYRHSQKTDYISAAKLIIPSSRPPCPAAGQRSVEWSTQHRSSHTSHPETSGTLQPTQHNNASRLELLTGLALWGGGGVGEVTNPIMPRRLELLTGLALWGGGVYLVS